MHDITMLIGGRDCAANGGRPSELRWITVHNGPRQSPI